ncbi:protein asteroid homolog 1-like isoform X2 [Dendronephthya gigantea]|uniref:protein asteroid homolog 1-like isoform X2 n=1 Tax=Dendronephthya gigantea TaxID=151771 RepID=UPI00106CE575|nr:protein asteroid homolog 1-like isoform X2 [Dendronephthya gigantea]
MGVRGLTSYVNSLPCGKHAVWKFYKLQDTNLIIDGCGLYYYIYASNDLNMKYGGQYEQLQDKVREFVAKLRSNNVLPYVVIDGIMAKDEKKFDTYLKRKQDCVKRMKAMWSSRSSTSDMVIPRLAQIAFVQVLEELGVKYAVADFEADCEIASLANELDAPVMANDSDFYIFNVKGGYIPFQQYDFSGGNITVKKFKFRRFAKYLGIDPGMLPLLASLIGNDYVSDTVLQPFMAYLQHPRAKIPAIANFLSEYRSMSTSTVFKVVVKSIPSGLQQEFEQALRLSVEEYQTKESNLIGYFSSNDLSCNIVTFNDHSLPQWAVQLFRADSVAPSGFASLCNRKVFLRPQCEDTSKPSAQECVQDLRWYYYAMLQHFENAAIGRELEQPQSKAGAQSLVTEKHQQSRPNTDLVEMIEEFQIQDDAENSLSNSPCKPHQDISSPLECTNRETNSKEITVAEFDREGSTLATRKVNLTQIISQINIQIDDIREMSNDAKKSHLLKLLGSDLSFIHNLAIGHQLVVAALRYWIIHCDVNQKQLAAILVHYVGEKPRPIKPNKFLQDVLIRTVHGFSQWQNVVYWTEKLNSLFSAPFPHLQAAKLYNGIQVCLVHEWLISEEGVEAESMVINPNLYRLLEEVITKDLPDYSQFKPA